MLYLVICPEYDYEIFYDDIPTCMKRIESLIIEADNSIDAICKVIKNNTGCYSDSVITSENIKKYFVLEVSRSNCEVPSKEFIKELMDKELEKKKVDEELKERKEFEKIKAKYERLSKKFE